MIAVAYANRDALVSMSIGEWLTVIGEAALPEYTLDWITSRVLVTCGNILNREGALNREETIHQMMSELQANDLISGYADRFELTVSDL
jgi:hypothetical protein